MRVFGWHHLCPHFQKCVNLHLHLHIPVQLVIPSPAPPSGRLASPYTSRPPPLPPSPNTSIDDGTWGADVFEGHAIGCNAVSWAPAVQPGSLLVPHAQNTLPGQAPAAPPSVKRFASAGCDNLVRIWGFRDDTQAWVEEDVLEGHTDWVRDVAWAPNIGLPRSYIATASQVRPAPAPSMVS